MPIFEYVCTKCKGTYTAVIVKTTDMEPKVCVECGHPTLVKVPSAPAISKLATPAYS
jgi:putative FmdB family regulatory protein